MKKSICKRVTAVLLMMTMLGGSVSCGIKDPGDAPDAAPASETASSEAVSSREENTDDVKKESPAEEKTESSSDTEAPEEGDLSDYAIMPDLSNVINISDYEWCSQQFKKAIAEHGFVVGSTYGREFFELYEHNRYLQKASYVTVDSMMHTYHLYFSYLQKRTEREKLYDELSYLVRGMLKASIAQSNEMMLSSQFDDDTVKWHKAAWRNIAFFLTADKLINGWDADQPAVTRDVGKIAESEYALVMGAEGIAVSPLSGEDNEYEDYSQYKPRGYYEGDEDLERYFRTMMWLGRRNFAQENDISDRAALLQTVALADNDSLRESWSTIYDFTGFFAGKSDDSGYTEYRELLDKAYNGSVPEMVQITGMGDEYNEFHRLTGELEPPAINSVPYEDDGSETDRRETAKGYRFMGQRFTIDAAVWQELVYSRVKENSNGENRMLPSGLDIPAALGSDTALDILKELGETDYKLYPEHMSKLRQAIQNAPDELWSASLYASWLSVLRPLLTEKDDKYPPFMRDPLWVLRQLECFMGSFAELKHDTVLYSKQVVAEMGGGWEEDKDTRGYVEPEPEIFRSLSDLVDRTRDGLKEKGLSDVAISEELTRLSELAGKLAVIADKELNGELPTEEEFLLIEDYGGTLEHFWYEVVKDEAGDNEVFDDNFPAAIITDVATDPNGSVLEMGTGSASAIYVIVPVEGKLRIASGTVYNYYEFIQPISDRLTDTEWRIMMGIAPDENGEYHWFEDGEEPVDKPEWTTRIRIDPYVDDSAALPDAEADWEVQKTLTLDIDRDGRKDLAALVEKEGSYGGHKPFWEGDEPPGRSQHIFIYETDEDTGTPVRAKWMSSALPAGVADMEVTSAGLSVPQALLITGTEGETSLWGWLDWGLTRLDESRDMTTVSLVMAGDVLLHTGVEQSAVKEDGSRDFSHIFDGTRDIIQEADLAIVNQETIIGGEELGISGYPSFNAPFEAGDALAEAGFDVILHANNHVLDKGRKGLMNCMEFWDSTYPDMEYLGIHDSAEDSEEIYFFEKGSLRISVLNFTYGTNGIPVPEDMPWAVDIMNDAKKDRIEGLLKSARESSDFVIVCPHWGTEYKLSPDSFQRKWDDIFFENGADLVIGTHPHVIEPLEWRTDEETGRRMLTIYSLGNFVNWTSGRGEGTGNRVVGGLACVTIGWNENATKAVIRNYDIVATVCQLEKGFGGVRVIPLHSYSGTLAEKNLIREADPSFSNEFCISLCDSIWGNAWR